jgi:Sulfotransferase family
VTPEASSSYSATAGLPFDDEELESRLVWIWGSPRTGSTWLLEMLCHPLQARRSEPLGFTWPEAWRDPVPAVAVDEFLISSHLAPHQGRVIEIFGAPFPATLNGLYQRRSSYAFSEEFADVWRPEARRLTLVRLHAVVERARNAGLDVPDPPTIVIKEVNGSHAADLVMSLFPRSRMILMLRDGRDIVDSLLDANSPDGWLTKTGLGRGGFDSDEERLEWVRETCRNWVARINVCMQAYERHDPALRRQVRYEDLLADTPGVLGGLVRWLDLPDDERRIEAIVNRHAFSVVPERMRGSGRRRRAATPGRWRDALTPEEQKMALEIMGSRLVELGYEGDSDPG